MKKNDKAEILSRDLKDLRKLVKEKKDELFNLVLDNSQFKLKNNRQIFHTKKDIARILSAIREKELAIPQGKAEQK